MKQQEYEDLLKNNYRRSMFEMAHLKIKELYKDEFLVYPKCIFGSRKATIYYISSTNIVVVSFGFLEKHNSNEFPIQIAEVKSKLLSKQLTIHQNSGGIVEMKLIFENDIELDFHNLDDSNANWHEDYYESILSIYKTI